MNGFSWWQNQDHVTSEIYLNTNRADWWKACEALARTLNNAKSILDVGGGDGHTLWQVLSVAFGLGGLSQVENVEIVEPDVVALQRAKTRLATLPIKHIAMHAGTLESCGPQILAGRSEKFDVVFVCHSNYYFGRDADDRFDQATYHRALDLLLQLGKRVVVATSSAGSDYYRVTIPNPFPDDVYSESVTTYYRSKGTVKVVSVPVRFYVAHADQSKEEAILLWQFFHNKMHVPKMKELEAFKTRLREVRDEDGNINFRDEIIVVS